MSTIKINLTEQSIDNLIKKIERYKNNIINKNSVFIERLMMEVGIPVIESNVNDAEECSNKSVNTYIRLSSMGETSRVTLIAEGEQLLFIEFGAGVYYNGHLHSSPHPKGEEFGYTIGDYGWKQGEYDSWYYRDNSGQWVETHGTEATMPMYEAGVKMRQKMIDIAREVFGSR